MRIPMLRPPVGGLTGGRLARWLAGWLVGATKWVNLASLRPIGPGSPCSSLPCPTSRTDAAFVLNSFIVQQPRVPHPWANHGMTPLRFR